MKAKEFPEFTLNIVTPYKVITNHKAKMVVVPGIEGEFGVLANHAPFITAINSGVVKVFDEKDFITEKIFIEKGYANVNHNDLVIICEYGIDITKLSEKELKEKIFHLEQEIVNTDNSEKKKKLEIEFKHYMNIKKFIA